MTVYAQAMTVHAQSTYSMARTFQKRDNTRSFLRFYDTMDAG